MKTIIAGSRDLDDPYGLVCRAVKESGFEISEIVSGTARGADVAGEMYARSRGIPCKKMPAPWKSEGKKAGIIRNIAMAEYADALIAVWDGKSSGTHHMINAARERGLKAYVLQHT